MTWLHNLIVQLCRIRPYGRCHKLSEELLCVHLGECCLELRVYRFPNFSVLRLVEGVVCTVTIGRGGFPVGADLLLAVVFIPLKWVL